MNETLYLPTVLWGIITGFSLIVILLALGMYLWYQKRTLAVIEDASSIAELSAQKTQLEADIGQCRQWLDNNKEELLRIEADRQQQELLRQELANSQMQVAQEEQKAIDLRQETSELQNAVSALSQEQDKIQSEREKFENAKNEAEGKAKIMEQLLQQRRAEMETVHSELREKRRELSEFNKTVTELQLRKEALSDEIGNKESKISEIEEALQELESSKLEMAEQFDEMESDLSEATALYEETQGKYESARDKLHEAENKTRSLEARNVHLEEQARGWSGDGHTVSPYDSIYELPDTFTKSSYESAHSNYTEEGALDDLQQYLKDCNLFFPTRVIKSFHTSLKISDISPLVVMAGISGTGKSELPRRYAEALGMHFLLMAVQPRWDSPQDMFGFYNYLEHQYKATELTRSLVQMDQWNYPDKAKYSDRMLLVLLDEMNLARVEYYFSEFLSKLEIRRTVDPDDENERKNAEIFLDTGAVRGFDIPKLYVHRNALFVGTMNEDESTQTLSDKVIDRANVLRFGRPEKMTSKLPALPNKGTSYLTYSTWEQWQKKDDHINPQARNDIESWISKINNALDEIGRPFGYRINQAMFSYIANYPSVNAQNNHRLAFADQLEQKVLPKLRGVELSAKTACFDTINEVIDEIKDEELVETYEKATDPNNNILFAWTGVTRKQ